MSDQSSTEPQRVAFVAGGSREFGLFAYLHTTDRRRVERFVNEVECGTVVINGMGRSSPDVPFGGAKDSGFGREGGRAGIEEMVRLKTVFG